MPKTPRPQPGIPELKELSDKQLEQRDKKVWKQREALEAEAIEISLEIVRRAVRAEYPDARVVDLERWEDEFDLPYDLFKFHLASVTMTDGSVVTHDGEHAGKFEDIEVKVEDDLWVLEKEWAPLERDKDGYPCNLEDTFPIFV